MDAGRFERSRARFWTWIVTPLVVIVLAAIPSWFYLARVQRVLTQRRGLLESIRPVEERMRRSESLLRSLVPDVAHRAETADDLTRRIGLAAQKHDFSLRAVDVDKETGDAGELRTLRVTVNGQGSLPALIGWLQAVQSPGALLRVEKVRVTTLSLPPDDAVNAEVVFVLFLGASVPAEGGVP
jgi:hypothetical protein